MATEYQICWNSQRASKFEVEEIVDPISKLQVGDSQTFNFKFLDEYTGKQEKRVYQVKRKSNKRLDFNRVDGYRAAIDAFNVFKWRSVESSALSLFVNKRDKIAPDQFTFPGFQRFGQTCFMNAALKQIISECQPDLEDRIQSTFTGKTSDYCKLAIAFAKLSDECHKVKRGAGISNIERLHTYFYHRLQKYASFESERSSTKATKACLRVQSAPTKSMDNRTAQQTAEPLNTPVSPPKLDTPRKVSPETVFKPSPTQIEKQPKQTSKITADELSNVRMLNKLFCNRGSTQQDSHEFIQFLVELANLKSTTKEITEDSTLNTIGTSKTTKLPGEPNPYYPLLLDKKRTLAEQLSTKRSYIVAPESQGKSNRKKVDYISSQAPRKVELIRIQVKLFGSYGFFGGTNQSRLGCKAKALIPKSEIIEVDIFNSTTNKNEKCKFRIQSIVVHEGESLNSGHYYTLERGKNDTWIKHDDDTVTVSTKPLSSHFSSFSDAAPYLIVLKKAK